MYARVVELVDTLALGASASGREGSSPFSRTKEKRDQLVSLFFGIRMSGHGSSRKFTLVNFRREGSRSAAQFWKSLLLPE